MSHNHEYQRSHTETIGNLKSAFDSDDPYQYVFTGSNYSTFTHNSLTVCCLSQYHALFLYIFFMQFMHHYDISRLNSSSWSGCKSAVNKP